MKKIILAVLSLLFVAQLEASDKHALIIAIGKYPSRTGWGTISSAKDVELIKSTLLNQGFSESNIVTVIDAQATKKGILNAFDALKNKIKEGDVVVVHYSGHGQQIFDDNGDEADGLDEALVPYDAFVRHSHAYTGENHIRDDQVGLIIADYRNKLGSKGQLLFLMDSCHSGSMTRGGIARGGVKPFAPDDWEAPKDLTAINDGASMFDQPVIGEDAAPFIMISGASADELNYEYNGYGSLSYSFAKAMGELGTDFTYRQLFSSIAANLNVICPRQTPTIEGDIDMKLFKGEYVKQNPYFDVTKVASANQVLSINGGQVNHIFDNTTVYVMPAGSQAVDESKALAKGTVTASQFGNATIVLDKALKDDNAKNYWVFIDKPSYGDIAVSVFFDSSVTDASIKDGVTSFLAKNSLGEVVTDSLFADVFVYQKEGNYHLGHAKGVDDFQTTDKSRGAALDDINSKIFNYAQGNYLKALNIKNNAYEFEFKLVPVEYSPATRRVTGRKEESDFIGNSGVFQVAPSVDHVVLQVTNKSDKTLYISIVEINSAGEISPFFPNDRCNLHNDERKLAPGQTVLFRNCVYSFGPPYERLVLKGFASDKPLNFQPTVKTRGPVSGSNNPLEKFIQQSYSKTRGSEAESISGDMEGYSTEFVYDIVRK